MANRRRITKSADGGSMQPEQPHTEGNVVCLAEKAKHLAMVRVALPPFLWLMVGMGLALVACAAVFSNNGIIIPLVFALICFSAPFVEICFILYTRWMISLSKGTVSTIQIFQDEQVHPSKYGPIRISSNMCHIDACKITVQLSQFHSGSLTSETKLLPASVSGDAIVYSSKNGNRVFAIVLDGETLLMQSPVEKIWHLLLTTKAPWY